MNAIASPSANENENENCTAGHDPTTTTADVCTLAMPDSPQKQQQQQQRTLGKRKRDWNLPSSNDFDVENGTTKPPKPEVKSSGHILFRTTRIAQLLRILECIQTVVEYAIFHFTPNGFTVFESSKHSVAHINLVLNKTFFNEFRCVPPWSPDNGHETCGSEERLPTERMSIRGKCNTKDLFTNVSILKKYHNAKAIVFDVSQAGILTHTVSQHGEYIQTGPVPFENCAGPVHQATVDDDSASGPLVAVPCTLPVLPKTEQYSLVEQMPSKRLKAHCVSANLKGCKNLRFVHDPLSCSVIIEDADKRAYHTKMVIVKPMENSTSVNAVSFPMQGKDEPNESTHQQH